jgi:exonuclease SbcD
MFKFLHAADLHLGKVFHDQGLGDEQEAMLSDLAGLLAAPCEDASCKDGGSYAALVIAGDVYDRSIPSPDAVKLFGSFLSKIKGMRPSPEIIVVPGNHDSAARLGFGRELFSQLGIHFGVSAEECDKPVVIERNGESCAFYLLPFLNPGDFFRDDPESGRAVPVRSQADLAAEAVRRMEKARLAACPKADYSVLAAHLFTAGGNEAGSERVFLGNAEQVNPDLFKGFDYAALGHLHRCQSAGGRAWYSGSPLAYSFAEAGQEKFFLSVELAEGGPQVEKIPVKPRRRVTSLSGPFARFTGGIPVDAELAAVIENEDYLEIRLTGREITENAGDILRKRFPRLLSLRQDEALAGLSSAMASRALSVRSDASGERRDLSEDFGDFLLDIYGEADKGKQELFNALLAEASDTSETSGKISAETSGEGSA